jgi:hypothetical protein
VIKNLSVIFSHLINKKRLHIRRSKMSKLLVLCLVLGLGSVACTKKAETTEEAPAAVEAATTDAAPAVTEEAPAATEEAAAATTEEAAPAEPCEPGSEGCETK